MSRLLQNTTNAKTRRSFTPVTHGLLQRKCACGGNAGIAGECAVCRKKRLSHRISFEGAAELQTAPPIVHEVLRSPGQPLENGTREIMESRFGHDFSQMRVHTDSQAAESAKAVNALAYTVGKDVVFGAGQYAPASSSGQRLLAHEMTHVVQQSHGRLAGVSPLTETGIHQEIEADKAANAVANGQSDLPPISASGTALQRDEADESGARTPAPGDVERRAQGAEAACRIGELCGLRTQAPTVVTDDRIRTAVETCFPGRLIPNNPCLSPEFVLPRFAASPSTGPVTAPTAVPARAGGRQQPSLSSRLRGLTMFTFNLGPAQFTLNIPSSLKIRLPVALRGSRSIVFNLSATPSGAFSFSIVLNAIPHVRITASAGVNVESRTGTAGLTVTTTRTVCRAQNPEAARRALTSAGNKLKDAIVAFQSSVAAGGSESTTDRMSKLGDVVSAISDVNSAVDRAKQPCTEVPVVELGLGAQVPFGQQPEGQAIPEPAVRPSPFFGATATFRF